MLVEVSRRKFLGYGVFTAVAFAAGKGAAELRCPYGHRLAHAVSTSGDLGPLYYIHLEAPVSGKACSELWRDALVRAFQLGPVLKESLLGETGFATLECLHFRDGMQLDMQSKMSSESEETVLTLRGKLAVATFTI